MYHKVFLQSPTEYWVDVGNFYRQMCELKCKNVVCLDEYEINNPNQVVITFDGVYKNILEYATPILEDFGYLFELFVTGDYIGKVNSFDTVEPRAEFASIEELSELVNCGGRLQWHSRTHQNLKNITDLKVIRHELSIPEELRKIDKEGFKWFAYPHGDFNEILIQETKKQFNGGISCVQGNDYDLFKLNRITVTNEISFRKGSIAVIIASYNYGPFLVEAIESVLRQIRPADEILIADDHSTDNTEEIALVYVKKYPNLIKYMRNESNLGIVRNFNKAVSLTQSDYICFLGADNRFRSDYIEKTAEILDYDDNIGIAYSDFALFGTLARIFYSRFPEERKGGVKEDYYYIIDFPDFNEESKKELLEKGNFIHGSSMYRRRAFEDAGGYKEEKGDPEDYNLFRRIIKTGWNAKKVPVPILEYRQHSKDQINTKLGSYQELNFYKEQFQLLQKELEAARNKVETKLKEGQNRIVELESTINQLQNSLGYRMLTGYRRLKESLLPSASRRRAVYEWCLKQIKS